MSEGHDARQAFGALAGWPRCEGCDIYQREMRAYERYSDGMIVHFCRKCRVTKAQSGYGRSRRV